MADISPKVLSFIPKETKKQDVEREREREREKEIV